MTVGEYKRDCLKLLNSDGPQAFEELAALHREDHIYDGWNEEDLSTLGKLHALYVYADSLDLIYDGMGRPARQDRLEKGSLAKSR